MKIIVLRKLATAVIRNRKILGRFPIVCIELQHTPFLGEVRSPTSSLLLLEQLKLDYDY
jgi:hypothetical protein